MKIGTRLWLGFLASLALASSAWGQPVVVAPTTVTPTNNLWSYLCMTPEQKFACKTWWCNSAIGQLVSGASGPVGLASGGLLGGRCELNAIDNAILNKPPEGSESTAARIMKDEIEAKARRAAVRYLGTVDCNYWPDASKALRLSLRGDPNECVRFEAALALRNGCCCTNEIIKALEHSVTGSKADGFPAERSDRVRAAAADALARCPMIETIIEEKKEDIKKVDAGPIVPKDYYEKVANMPRSQVVASARSALTSLQSGGRVPMTAIHLDGTPQTVTPQPIQRRPGSLAGLLTNTFQTKQDYVTSREPEPRATTLPAVVTTPQPQILPQPQTLPQPQVIQQPKMLPPLPPQNVPVVPASTATPYSSTIGLKVETKTPVPASNPNTIRQSTGWVTVETPPATIGAPMPVGATPMAPRR